MLLKPLVEMMFREVSALLSSNKCLPRPVIGECLRMTDFSSDPLLESESCALLCCGAIEYRKSIKLYKNPFFLPLMSEMNISISVCCLWEGWRLKVSINFCSNN